MGTTDEKYFAGFSFLPVCEVLLNHRWHPGIVAFACD